MLDQAIALAAAQFQGKFDKGGKPYILHCLHVMNNVDQNDEELMIIAVLHDLVEDTPMVFNDLHQMGFSSRVISALYLLTRGDDEPYSEYIEGICSNEDAIRVKMADLEHNSDITRLKGLRDKDLRRIEKYHRAYEKLKENLK